MAFDARNVGRCSTDGTGAIRIFTYKTSVDAIATVVASGYFDTYASQIRTGDWMLIDSSDESRICRLINTANVITVGTDVNFS